jgi:uncharacterized protein
MPPSVAYRTAELAGLPVPLIELTGTADGPLLTVLAGVHGCEYASMAGVRRWARELQARELRGRVRAAPVLNLPAFTARSAFVVPQDGKNLNRCFPGDPAGTLADRLAYDVFTQLIDGSDALVDAHCGDLVEALQPFAFYDGGPSEDRARELALAYGLPYVLRQQPSPDQTVAGSTSAAAAAAGIPAIIAEAGGCGLVEEHAVQLHIAGLNRVLATLGMTDEGPGDPADPPVPTFLGESIWPRCRQAGWWEPAVRPGDAVAKGQLLGTISSLDGATVLETIAAPAAGIVMFLTSSPAVAADGLLLGLGIPR